MKVRFQVLEPGGVALDVVLESRSQFVALHELLRHEGVAYDPDKFKSRGGSVEYRSGGRVFRASKLERNAG